MPNDWSSDKHEVNEHLFAFACAVLLLNSIFPPDLPGDFFAHALYLPCAVFSRKYGKFLPFDPCIHVGLTFSIQATGKVDKSLSSS